MIIALISPNIAKTDPDFRSQFGIKECAKHRSKSRHFSVDMLLVAFWAISECSWGAERVEIVKSSIQYVIFDHADLPPHPFCGVIVFLGHPTPNHHSLLLLLLLLPQGGVGGFIIIEFEKYL